MERMQIGLGCQDISHMKHIVFCYFKINCFSGVDTICRSLSSKSQYMWYVAHPISGTPKDLPQSGNWYLSVAGSGCSITYYGEVPALLRALGHVWRAGTGLGSAV